MRKRTELLGLLVLAASCAQAPKTAECPAVPEAAGLSALYAAVLDGSLVVAGGSNFAGKPLAEGGKKQFHDNIYRLEPGGWKEIGRLPEPSAYGACFTLEGKLVIAGGANERGTLRSVRAVAPDGRVSILPDLPVPVEQGAACVQGGTVYLLGGLSDGAPVTDVLRCADGVWEIHGALPEPMVQPVAFAAGGRLYVWGGYHPTRRESLDYGYEYSEGTWTRIPGPEAGETLTGAASTVADGRLIVTGGVDKAVFDQALSLSGDAVQEYLTRPAASYRIRSRIRAFDPASQTWRTLGESPHTARAGAALASAREDILYHIGGEIKPGVRTPAVWKIQLK